MGESLRGIGAIIALLVLQFSLQTKSVYANETEAPTIEASEMGEEISADCEEALASTQKSIVFEGAYLIVDTNTIEDDPNVLTRFPGATIILPGATLEELDQHNHQNIDPSRKYNVRAFLRELYRVQMAHQRDNFKGDIRLKGGSTLIIDHEDHMRVLKKTSYDVPTADNRIMATALAYRKKYGDDKVFILTSDVQLSKQGYVTSFESFGT